MTKKYTSKTNVSINIVLPSKKNMHVSFIPMSDGSSYYVTDNEDVQHGIEHHYQFGNMFKSTFLDEPKKKVEIDEVPKEEVQRRVVKVSDLAMAKDYLADTFGISRTSLRSEKTILEHAAMHGIEFDGI